MCVELTQQKNSLLKKLVKSKMTVERLNCERAELMKNLCDAQVYSQESMAQ